jgi:tRNA pseudouridine55 synthase
VTPADSEGVFVLDKPKGPTSFDLVARARRTFSTREIGHAGTLDPLATGVLVILVGRYTKLQRLLMDHDKRYRATVSFGARTSTDDAAGEVLERGDPSALTAEQIRSSLAGFVGPQQQIPPAHSAIHIDGERAYAKARRGEHVEMAPRSVVFHALTLESFKDGVAVVDVSCSKGTYIRSLARDLGGLLHVPAHLADLSRTSSGGFSIAQAAPEALLDDPARARAALLRGRAALVGTTTVEIDDAAREHLRHGRSVAGAPAVEGTAVAVCGEEIVALVETRDGALRSVRGF